MREETVRYIFKRLIWLVVYLLIVSFLVFYIGRFGPGDPALIRAGPKASEETIQRIRQQMGLDRPILIQYLDYMSGFLRGDLGESLVYPDKSVNELLFERILISTPIVLLALAISLIIGIAAGLISSLKKGSWIGDTLIGIFLFFSSIPSLVLIQFLILIFALQLHLLPAKWSGSWESVFTSFIILPVLCMVLRGVSDIARLVRTTTLAVLDENYVRFAKAKGLPLRIVATKYILRNALLPLITMVVPSILLAIEGSFFIEALYGIPGTGQFIVTAIFQRDYPVITGFTLIISFLYVIGNLIADLLYKVFDPRIELMKRG